MKAQYDFSKGERGKFFRADAKLNLPVYLDEEVFAFVSDLAEKKKKEVTQIVNDLLRSDMSLAQALQ